MDGPADLKLYLHASEAEGLWLAFDTRTPGARRGLLLTLLADMAARVRAAAEKMGAPVRAEEKGRALAFWRGARVDALRKEAEAAEDLLIGRIAEEGAARSRHAGATTRAERALQTPSARPSEALAEFARQQLDHAFENVRRTAGAGGEGGPNLHPFVAMRKGGQTFRTVLSYYSEPEAVAACPRVVCGRGEVEAVALVCDGILRVGGERTDALIVRAQERGSPSSQVFAQRYRAPGDGRSLSLVGNWLLTGTDVSLFSEQAPASGTDGPSDSLRLFAEKCLEDRLRWIVIGDETGAKLYRDDQPLFSPTLELRVGEQTLTNVFAMGNQAWAEAACPKVIAEKPGVSFAVLIHDDVTTVDGRHARTLRFRAQELGAQCSWVFAQAYEKPQEGRRFATAGAFELLGPAESLFLDTTASAAASPPAPPAVDAAQAAAERRRLELSRTATETLRPARTSVLHGGGSGVTRETDPTARLRFAATKCEFDEEGIRAWFAEGEPRALRWSELAQVAARQLPADAPWERSLLLDFLPGAAADAKAAPIRVVRSTLMNFRGLPGGPAPARSENLRRLAAYALSRNPAAKAEAESAAFFGEGKDCPRVLSIAQLVEYDSRYG